MVYIFSPHFAKIYLAFDLVLKRKKNVVSALKVSEVKVMVLVLRLISRSLLFIRCYKASPSLGQPFHSLRHSHLPG